MPMPTPAFSLAPTLDATYWSNQGKMLAGGKLYSYQAGSFSSLQDTFTDVTGSVANSNPIVLNSSGRLGVDVFLQMGYLYNLVLTDANDTVLSSWDGIEGAVTSQYVTDQLAGLSGSFLPLSGGTVSGTLTVGGTSNLQVVNASSISATGAITASGLITGDGVNAGGKKVTNVLTPVASTDAANKGYVDAGLGGATAPPVGSIIMWPSAVSPGANWLTCNGAAVSRTTYASLFTVLSTLYGSGDGSTTFNLPDYRGIFPRGLDSGKGYDTARALGTYQADALQNIVGYLGVDDRICNGGAAAGAFTASSATTTAGRAAGAPNIDTTAEGGDGTNHYAQFSASNSVGTRTADETRPKNVSVVFVIRAL